MYPRTEYEMTEKDLKSILNACKPTPVMFTGNGVNIGGSQQENANTAWEKLGNKMGFDYNTVRPVEGKGNRFFTAIPSETKIQRQEREAKEKKQKRLDRVSELKKEISDRETELNKLKEPKI